ncbi:MAG: ATP-dependent RecD-like DNA helicase [Anaerolineales bacterium]|nr:ATP-dependent RecD-like DNA helicase [Anaerolineales bacterium]
MADTLSGSVERITYYNAENGYSVLRLRPDQRPLPCIDREGLVTITGNLPEISPGEHLRLSGRWVNHPKHGLQLQAETCEQILPATVAGIRRYLGSGLVKGIGPRLAERIVVCFGRQTLDVIENQPERLREVPDIGPKRSHAIAIAWEEQKQVKEIMLFLHSHQVSTNLAVKIYKQYGAQALNVVRSDPYRLAQEIYGVGFKTADRIAQALGLPNDHSSRIEAGVIYALNEMTDEGHVYAPQHLLAERAAGLLELSSELVEPALERLEKEAYIRQETIGQRLSAAQGGKGTREAEGVYGQRAIYLTALYHSETGVDEFIRRLTSPMFSKLSDMPPAFLASAPELSIEQNAAIRTAISHPLSILTGGPGTGKTTCIRALVDLLEASGKQVALASPTGRAAKRLSEATGRAASTIHRLLGYKPGEGFKHNADNPLLVDLLVIDEASMLDLILAYHLLKAVQPGTHLLLVGDIDQLPSVGAGDVLRDVIASRIAPVTRLSTIFRQAAGSQIITNAHRINQGLMPIFSKDSQDLFLFTAEEPAQAANWVIDVVCKRIPEKFGFDPRQHIQVLAPMYRGPAGVDALNQQLQAMLNPPDPRRAEKGFYGRVFRTGDKVMQIQNNYDKEVFNGDIGLVCAIDPIEHVLQVDFEGRRIDYDWSEADQLVLAYAVSVHKAQGAEFPAVVIPLLTSHYMMLQRNLLYTAITRARKLCVLVGNQKAIRIAVRNNHVAQRFTALEWRLAR